MAYSESYLYYGNGECSLESPENITALEITYKGKNVKVESKVDSSFIFIHRNNKILIMPMSNGTLSELFIYSGGLEIINALFFALDTKPIYPQIKKQMDYTELLDSNTETMDRLTEEIGITIRSSKQTVNSTKLIENLNTRTQNEILKTEDGADYEGSFHIHMETDMQIMSGATHTKDSINLYRHYSKEFIQRKKKNNTIIKKYQAMKTEERR